MTSRRAVTVGLLVLGLTSACSEEEGTRGGYDCASACDHALNTCGLDAEYGDVQQCTTTCDSQPWSEIFIECRSTTCDSDDSCQNWTINGG